MADDLRAFGGVPISLPRPGVYAAAAPLDEQTIKDALADPAAELAWNFGIDLTHPHRQGMAPDMWGTHQAAAADKATAGLPLKEWDGKTPTFRMAMTKKIKHHGTPGLFLPAQYQPRGTCVGRGASGAINVFQTILCLQGWPFTWMPVSHAWCYAGARMQYNDLGSEDGAVGQGAFQWCRDKGVCYQAEVGDPDYYKDDIAVKWARTGIPSGLIPLGRDNPLTDAFPVTSAKKACDVLFSGGAVTVASNQGFTSTRDADGFCRPSGSWAHQMHFVDIIVTANGRKGLACVQSWGEDAQSGPKLPEQPGYVFGVDMNVADAMLRVGDSQGAMNFDGFLAELSWGT
jgi:hypothetical protein